MYIVKIKNSNIETPIHDEREKLNSGKVVKGINTIDSFTFSMLPANKGFNLINEFQTRVTVYNTNKKRYDFIGRVLHPESSMSQDGLIEKSITCENVFGYLCDSQQPWVATKNWTVRGLFQHFIDNHNSQVEAYKQFAVGEVTVTDPNDNLYLGIQRENTWDAIKKNLIDKLGGELRYRVVDDVIYIDYLEKIGATRATPIELSVNMKAITREKDPTSYVTRLIPLGAKLGDNTEERLDITSVNNGLNYIDDQDAIAAYGIHVGYVTFDDVTLASNLLRKGQAWMAENNRVQIKYSVTNLDLSLIGLAVDDMDVGDYHPIKNPLLGIDDTARIIKKSIDICEEVKSTIEMGDNFKTLNDIQQEQIKQLEEAAKNLQSIQSATNDLQEKVTNTQLEVDTIKDQVEGVPSDLDEELNNLNQRITEESTSVLNNCNQILMSALQNYVETSNYEEFRKAVEAQVKLLKDEFSIKFEETETKINNVDGDLQSKFNQIATIFEFNINGFSIGKTGSPYKIFMDDNEFSMLLNGVQVLWFELSENSHEANIPELNITKKLNLFGFLIDQDSYGNVNCEYVGG